MGADRSDTLQHVHSTGEWFEDWMLLLTSAAPLAMHCRALGDDDALECPEQFCDGLTLTDFAIINFIWWQLWIVPPAGCDDDVLLARGVRCPRYRVFPTLW